MTKRIEHLNYLERYCNEGTRTYSRYAAYSEAREEYQPGARRTSFELPCFSLPRGKLNIYTANPAPELAEKYLADRHALFCVHPQVLAEQRTDPYVAALLESGQPHDPIAVSPSASTRTLLVPDTTAEHALKVHFPFRVSRYDRRMRDEVIEQAINVSRELEAGIDRLDADFAFLREVIGVTHKNLAAASPRGENWGYLVRDMRPFPELDAECLLVPGFALYGRDLFARTEAPLLFELISAADPRGDVLEHIMLPIIRHWVACFVNFGYLLEPHAQNTLFEIDQQRQIRRIVHRDLSVGIDMRRRRELGLSDGAINSYNRMESGHFHSIVYDKFMGNHFFDRIIDVCRKRYPRLSAEDFRRPCREEFARMLPHHRHYFPARIHYFSERRDEFGKPLYEDTGRLPVWRPA